MSSTQLSQESVVGGIAIVHGDGIIPTVEVTLKIDIGEFQLNDLAVRCGLNVPCTVGIVGVVAGVVGAVELAL